MPRKTKLEKLLASRARADKKIRVELERVRHRTATKNIKEGKRSVKRKTKKKSTPAKSKAKPRKTVKRKANFAGLIKAIGKNKRMSPASKKKAIATLRRKMK